MGFDLGEGWSTAHSGQVYFDPQQPGEATVVEDDGTRNVFTPVEDVWQPPAGVFDVLTRQGGQWRLTRKSQSYRQFSTNGLLEVVADAAGNEVQIGREAQANDRIDSMIDGSCSNRLMTYFIDDQYDEEDEQVWYTYDLNGNVTRIVRQYADDDQYRSTWLVYDRGGRVSYVIGETWNSDDLDWQAGGEEGCEYALSNDAYTWLGARAYAQSRGGDLAGCLEGDECDWLFSEFHPGTEDFTRYWLGGLQDPEGEEPDKDWGKLIGDVPAATAILDRFLHHAEVITITGRSYRLKNRQIAKDQACKKAGK